MGMTTTTVVNSRNRYASKQMKSNADAIGNVVAQLVNMGALEITVKGRQGYIQSKFPMDLL